MAARTITLDEPELPFPPIAAPAPACRWELSPFAPFESCPMCGGAMAPEHAHFRCGDCGWRDSCCD